MPPRVSWRSFWLMILGCISLGGCSSLPELKDAPRSYKLTSAPDSLIAGYLAEPLAGHPGQSGVLPLFEGLDAMVARLALIKSAETSIDLQYYIFRNDDTGRLLAWQLLDAADRGVRVRLLLDDTASVNIDRQLAVMASHPNVSVRLYNPSSHRTLRALSFVTDFGRMNHRMHNKSLTVDNRLSVVGGRNIGNEYFSNDEDVEFGDLDVLLTGPVVEQVSDQFDAYWNGSNTYPVELLTEHPVQSDELAAMYDQIANQKRQLEEHPYIQRLTKSPLLRHMADNRLEWFWGEAKVLADPHDKREGQAEAWMITPLLDEFQQTRERLVIISPYFVPTTEGVRLLTGLAKRGVAVTVITNSLAATDVLAVHSGYKGYREALLRAGVSLYEVKATGKRPSHSWKGSSRSSLHAKSFLFDDDRLFVGSFNFDPRSAWLNTEMGVMVNQGELNQKIHAWLPQFLTNKTYQVKLGSDGLYWHELSSGKDIYAEPQAGFWRRFMADVLALFPLESQL
ncbi:phospholipase D family protein [Shewanella amazonensis]|uniref:Phopholipase D-family protein n=1 Tax=Shewanella amazonensis (strain ATCC BAA-1098 / SB2B) TaxID=326297 RepID=A1S7Q1_SHEAM|nr:phospholipase D family protein [Shewanella amazonensis]ABM00408.1 phopholipase D-family protein [Shewanella amazonensis SB2B]